MTIKTPEKLQFLYEPMRYKVLYGGRGGSKSRGFADACIIQGYQEKKLILCAREFQNSIADSVHSLLKRSIDRMNLNGFYQVQRNRIIAVNGTEIIFAGLRHNINNIKSVEDVDICWVEEAQTVSANTWEKLTPTVRKKGSEIWISFNPELDTDETYRRFVLNPPTNAKVVKIGWQDNPWFSETELPQEKADCKAENHDKYLNIWEGHCRQTVDGAVYAEELRKVMVENRILRVPPVPGKPIDTFWDLGHRDYTAIWFVQFCMGEYRILDFHADRGKLFPEYIKVLQEKGYLYGIHYLPHDGEAENLRGMAIDKQLKAVYPQSVKVVPRVTHKHISIDAGRTIFPLCYFDEEKCKDGLQALRRYRYGIDPDTGGYSKDPLHDENSDAADAFQCIALGIHAHKPKPKLNLNISPPARAVSLSNDGNGWLGR